MKIRILSVGQCGPDHATITRFMRQHFDAEVVGVDRLADTLSQLRAGRFDLVLVNRKLDADYSDGLEIIRAVKADPELAAVPMMLVTNYPEHQEAAVALGAQTGFGKLEYQQPETLEKLKAVLALASRLTILIAATVACFATASASAIEPQSKRPPNIVFLLSDDQRPDTIHALGNRIIDTPNLDSLVQSGVTFTRATCAHPSCVPSRAEILTGCTGFRNGIPYSADDVKGAKLNPDLPLWPATMRRAGYHTWYVGKWHTAGRPSAAGYEDTDGLYAGGAAGNAPYVDHRGRAATGYRGWQFQTTDGVRFPEQGVGLTSDISRRFADAAIRLIERKPQRPFFLHVNFTAPHDPRIFPQGYERKYDPAKLPLPANFAAEHPFDHGNLRGRDEVLLPFPRTAGEVRAELAAYYAVISHLDQQIGRILSSLKATGQWENTIVIFAADHGLALGSHGLVGKQNMYEHTIGVPLVMCGPGIPADVRSPAQCYLRDLYPTVCELAGIAIPFTVEGRSLAPVLQGKVNTVYPFVVGYFMNVQRMIRTERWKLIHYPRIPRWQLFDLKTDPFELHDLSTTTSHAATLGDLQEKLAAWRREHNDG